MAAVDVGSVVACAWQIEICRGDIREVERIKNVFVGILFFVYRHAVDRHAVDIGHAHGQGAGEGGGAEAFLILVSLIAED